VKENTVKSRQKRLKTKIRKRLKLIGKVIKGTDNLTEEVECSEKR
jgi:hypothetical protein